MIDKKIRDEIERKFRCGYYTIDQIITVYGITRDQAIEVIKPALDDGNYANLDPIIPARAIFDANPISD